MSDDLQLVDPSPGNVTVAVLGTGTMGAAMARNLLAAGYATRVWNRTGERAVPLAADGATVCGTAAEAARGATHLLTTLWDLDSVRESAREALPALSAGAVSDFHRRNPSLPAIHCAGSFSPKTIASKTAPPVL